MNIYLTDYRTASTTQTEMMEDIPYPQRVHWFADTYKNVSSGLVYPPHKLADKVLDPKLLEDLRGRSGKTAFILAAGNANFAGINVKTGVDNQLTYDYKFLPLTLTQVYAGRIAQMCGTNDMVITDSSACASSLKVMMNVRELFMLYGFDRVIVLTLEDAVSNPVLKFFGESKASLSKDQEDRGILPSAFDDVNYGFNIGQGAALAIFENAKYARNSKAQLLGAYTAAEESTNAIGQRADGQGFVRAATVAMDMAKIPSKSTWIVKTHGTGTKSNNQAESEALFRLFPREFIATSYKQHIGHTMGASGLLETCLLLDDMSNGFVPAIANRTKKDNLFLSERVRLGGSHNIISLAAGMGNVYSAAIFKTL